MRLGSSPAGYDPAVLQISRNDGSPVCWRLATRIAFRFGFLYFTLYVVATQMLVSLLALPFYDPPSPRPLRAVVSWVAAHVFGVSEPLVFDGGSGDKVFDWVLVFCLLLVAVAGTAIWSVLDRGRPHYTRLHRWFRLFVRFSLGATMISYGMAKAIPLQMPAPGPMRLVEPFGNFSPMGVLWAAIGASPSYEMSAGFAELAGGILICLPGLATIGALVCLADSMHVFTLNMCYDVPVKLFSFHLIVMSLVVLGPELTRLTNVILLNRAAGPSRQAPLWRTKRARWLAIGAQVVFTLYLLSMNVWGAQQSRRQYGDLAPTTPLKGIWTIDAMTVDGEAKPPSGSGAVGWRRMIIEWPEMVCVQRLDDSFKYFQAQIDMEASKLTLTRGGKPPEHAFTFTQPAVTKLLLDGTLDGQRMHIETSLLDHTKFPLFTRGFHWIQEYPFNR
jgi:hypothetical protein